MGMKLSNFKFNLPSSYIALHPAENRDESRLMVVHKNSGKVEHKIFKDVVEYFDEGDVFVINDTKVLPARLYGNKEKTGAKIEVFLLRELNSEAKLWDVLVDPARKIRIGNKLYFGDGELTAEVIDNTTSRGRTMRFLTDCDQEEFYKTIDAIGETPLPKEIQRQVEPEDRSRFQSIYAEKIGSVAAPMAGFHFTPRLMKKLELQGVDIAKVTLHVGLGTFRPIEVEDISKYKMESENYWVERETADRVNRAIKEKKKICAIDTTVMKALESSVSARGLLKENSGWTDKFIFPPYNFKICDTLITNFHLPESILFMAASAFGGYELIKEIYKIAIEKKYRFFSYGDAMLII